MNNEIKLKKKTPNALLTFSCDISFLSPLCCQTLLKSMSHYVNVLDSFCNSDDVGNTAVPLEKLNELQSRYVTLRVQLPHNENITSFLFHLTILSQSDK